MYCRVYELDPDETTSFVFQAGKRDPLTGRCSSIYARAGVATSQFPVRENLDESIDDLKSRGCDGEVMRYVKTKGVIVNSSCSPSFTAGLAAKFWIDTTFTDADTIHKTKEDLESERCLVSELYEGPFSLDDCQKIISDLESKISHLSIIKLGSGYNVAQVITFAPTKMAHIREGRLHINKTYEELSTLIDTWHDDTIIDGKELHEYLEMPFEAFSHYATTPSKCVFVREHSEG